MARDAGLVVLALDTPLDPIDSADMTFATDNFLAGELIGAWAAKTMGDASKAKIGLLNINVWCQLLAFAQPRLPDRLWHRHW